MSDAILVAIITAGTSIIVQLLINKQNNDKHELEQAKRDQRLDDKLEHIDTKLEEHNGYAKMFSDAKEAIIALQKDVEWIKAEVKK